MMNVRSAAKYCAEKVNDFPLNEDAISRKIYQQISAGTINSEKYTPQFGSTTIVVSEEDINKFISSDEFNHVVDVQRKKYFKRTNGTIIKNSNGIVQRLDKPIVGDIYIAPANNGFADDSILLVTSAGKNNVLLEEINTNKYSEINNGEIKSPVAFARTITELNNFNYYGNANNLYVVANKLSTDTNYSF